MFGICNKHFSDLLLLIIECWCCYPYLVSVISGVAIGLKMSISWNNFGIKKKTLFGQVYKCANCAFFKATEKNREGHVAVVVVVLGMPATSKISVSAL